MTFPTGRHSLAFTTTPIRYYSCPVPSSGLSLMGESKIAGLRYDCTLTEHPLISCLMSVPANQWQLLPAVECQPRSISANATT